MTLTPLHELSRCKIPTSKGEVPFFTWENSILTILTEKIISVLKLSHNVQCIDKKIDWIITDIPCPKSSPASRLFPKKFMKGKINNMGYTQMMLDPALWPHNNQLMEEMASAVSFQWSPTNFVQNNESVIAILNNVGNIELYGPTSCGYTSFLNLSSIIAEKYVDDLKGNLPQNVDDAKIGADAMETSSFCWGSQCDNTFSFVTAQKNGNVHFWQLSCDNKGTSVEELTKQPSDAGEIITMEWIQMPNDVVLLILTNIMGQLFVYKYEWENNYPKLINCHCPWPHKDRMVIKHLRYTIIEDKIVLLCNKYRHLLVLLIDENCNKIAEYLNNINDYKISVISETNNEFYIGTINCKIFKVNISAMDDKLNVTVEEIVIKENLVNYDLCGLAFSKNNVMCALGVINRKILYRKQIISLDIIFLCPEETHGKEMALLLENPTIKLTDYWDCLEMVRCKAMKLKILPSIDYNLLYTNCSNIYEMKLYRILLTYYHSLEDILKNKSKGCLPETSMEAVNERILALQASSVMTTLCRKIQNKETLTDFDSEKFAGTKKYLKYYCQKYKVDLLEFIPSGLVQVKEDDGEYACQCCDENVNGFSCPNGHVNMFCSLTLTPIESDEYICCRACGLIARKELISENPTCVFCDLHLNNYFLPT